MEKGETVWHLCDPTSNCFLQDACPPEREGFPLLLWLSKPAALALASRLRAKDCSLEISGPPSVIPRTLLPRRDLPDSPWPWDEPQVIGMKMQPRHQQPERDIKPSQNTSSAYQLCPHASCQCMRDDKHFLYVIIKKALLPLMKNLHKGKGKAGRAFDSTSRLVSSAVACGAVRAKTA